MSLRKPLFFDSSEGATAQLDPSADAMIDYGVVQSVIPEAIVLKAGSLMINSALVFETGGTLEIQPGAELILLRSTE